ncbi:MAG: hypothetical protein V4757_11930 [Pseudomonadota bacterium]
MDTLLSIIVSMATFGVPCLLLAVTIRHFVPLIRGMNAPWWAQALGPFLFFSDRFISEEARPHRRKFVGFAGAFIASCLVLVFVIGKA